MNSTKIRFYSVIRWKIFRLFITDVGLWLRAPELPRRSDDDSYQHSLF